MKELQSAQKQISDLRSEVAQAQLPLLTGKAETLASGVQMLAVQVDGMDAKSLQVRSRLWVLAIAWAAVLCINHGTFCVSTFRRRQQPLLPSKPCCGCFVRK